jgi:S-adenosylmethionine:diacylglycerol 3-amino-3-carboxypropyl transferase
MQRGVSSFRPWAIWHAIRAPFRLLDAVGWLPSRQAATVQVHITLRANGGNRIVTRQTPTHDYATTPTRSGAD